MSTAPASTWPPERGRSDYSARHLELLGELETIVLTEGFRDLTIGGLAQRLHCSRRTLYELAASKEDLVLLVIDRLLRRIARVAHDAMAEGGSHLERLRAFLTTGTVELHRATEAYSQDVMDDPAASALVTSHFRFAETVMVDMLDDGISAGEFAPMNTKVAAQVLDAGLARLQQPEVLRALGCTLAEAFEAFLVLFTDGIRSPAR